MKPRAIAFLLMSCTPLFACGGEDAGLTAEAPAPVQGLLLEVDPSIPVIQPLPDRTDVAQARTPWDNFHTSDPLDEEHGVSAKAPHMMLFAQRDRYEEDLVGAILREGKVNFWSVAELYRKGILSRDDQAEFVGEMRRRIAADPDETAYKANAIMGLVHLGFDEAVFEMVEEYKDEPWFSQNFDVNFYAGSLLFRYRKYTESVRFLEDAYALHPDVHTRLWLATALTQVEGAEAAERREEIFPFGEHAQGGTAEGFPFRDISDQLGIRRWQLAGALSFFDMDNDSYLDMVANGVYSHPELYRYKVGEGFVLTSDAALEDIHNTPPGMVAADFDNDGYRDLYLTQAAWFNAGSNRLLENNDGLGFVDRSGGDSALMEQNSCGAAALDFDRDGLVDLAVTGTMGGTLRLLKNLGNFVFEDVSDAAGIKALTATAVGLAVGDVDNDGWPDIFVNAFSPPHGGNPGTGFTTPNQLYFNQGDGTFLERGEERGVSAGTPMGFAAWMFDYDNDGDLDILATNFSRPEIDVVNGLMEALPWQQGLRGSALYKNDGTGDFEYLAEDPGFLPASIMGAQFVDFELDGDLDVVLGPGSHPLEFMQPLLFYRNDGGDSFTLITPMDNPHYYGKFHGIAFADIDRDGDPDLFANNGGVLLSDRWRDLFLENTTEGQNWVHLGFVGTESNASAIGARVSVPVGDRVLTQEVAAGQGFSSTNSPYLIFGLGEARATGPISVRWPTGQVQEIPALAAGQAIVVTEGSDVLRRVY